ncbi:hypothetical protein [Marinigracilibium pacificum]|uniref:Uncharacterized protein n=1 Tax=Marinigracilibium pacificum TaxID=2729599 RepID=A0A848J2Z3_9BACT|nr:hypothetical protein [Marinigracilibium pacificum]NMM49875.1 hypothetical protein [Marinigracilibium pacificum]
MCFKINTFKIIGLLLAPLIFGCNPTTLDPDQFDERKVYFPDDESLFRVYEVNRIDFFANGDRDTSKYRLKEKVATKFSAEEEFQVIERYRFRNNEWQLDSLWNIYYNNTNVVVYENNIPLVKLITPIKSKTTWDRNGFNAREERISEYVYFSKDTLISDNLYEQVVVVELDNIIDPIIGNDIGYEVYAPKIGLVSKYIEDVDYKQDQEVGNQVISQGVLLEQKLVTFGYE